VYMVNMKNFTNLKWGTMNPVAFRDSELGLIRLRAHGVFNVQIVQPVLFINSLVGTMGHFTTDAIDSYLKAVIVSRFNDYLGEVLDSILNLPGRFDELSLQLQKRLVGDFAHFGLHLSQLYITSITPPEEVQKAIDDKSRLNVIHDIDKFVKMKAVMAMEKAAENQGESGAGIGLGMGMMMPAMFAHSQQGGTSTSQSGAGTTTCPDCQNVIPADARFCPLCGHQQVVLRQCANCRGNLAVNAKFCPKCGHSATEKPQIALCSFCQAENLPGAMFCNQCGQRID
jgi:membrane protease subunit (stomatin/prohibitin family)